MPWQSRGTPTRKFWISTTKELSWRGSQPMVLECYEQEALARSASALQLGALHPLKTTRCDLPEANGSSQFELRALSPICRSICGHQVLNPIRFFPGIPDWKWPRLDLTTH